MDIASHSDLSTRLEKYVQMVDAGKGFDLYRLYGLKGDQRYRILPGHVVVIIADTGIGKTLLVQDWLRRLQRRTLYLNLEMQEELVVRRFLQGEYRMTHDEVIDRIRDGDAARMVEGALPWMRMVSDTPTIEQVERSVEQFKPEILVVDTTDGISVPQAGNQTLFQLRHIVEGLRHITQRHNIIAIAIHHINKSGARALTGENNEKQRALSLNDGTGDRATVTKADHVLGIEGLRGKTMRTLSSLKVRDGDDIRLNLSFDFNHMRVDPYREPLFNQLEMPL